jgi:tRNA modification GTPase
MLGKLAGWEDTIVALATPPGIGAIGVIRVSGHNTITIVNQLFPGKDLLKQDSHTLHVGLLVDGDQPLDEVVVSLFRNPRSYTGEDVVEISCHGSPYVQEQVIQALLRHGARLAKAGEFTQRAFLNGKLDLAQAEAVADLIASHTAASARTALSTIRGGFSRALRDLREQLISFSALIELELDFSQEDVEFADRTQLYHLITEASSTTSSLLASFKLGNVIRNGVSVAIVGKPNAGKSTLLNTLLNENRAIVSEIAGTTRDTIEEVLNIDGILFRLIDTAGIREHTADIIEQIGVGRSLEKMEQADIVVYLFDVSDDPATVAAVRSELVAKGRPFLLVGNKVDSFSASSAAAASAASASSAAAASVSSSSAAAASSVAASASVSAAMLFPQELLISAREGRHMDVFRQRLVDLVLGGSALNGDSTVVTNARHYHALQLVASSLETIRRGLDDLLPGDLLALDIRHCLHYLGEITGEITTEDRLDYIFSKFCVGK